MCVEEKEVVTSHLLPAGLYGYCRPPGGNPIVFSTKLVIESSRQMQCPLLCQECEDILNKNGENWMVPLFASLDGSFPFHDLLTSVPPAMVVGDAKVYLVAQNPKIEATKVVHFAMGIFWKAAVHSWIGGETRPLIDLGQHTESIRRYLRSEGNMPVDTVLMIGVLPKPVRHISITAPYKGSSSDLNNFLFYALGIEFTLLVGAAISQEQRGAAFSANPGRPVILVNFAPILQDIAVDVMKDAHKALNVNKYLKKP
jgi:hypothetical protein